VVDSPKVGFLNSEERKKEGRGPPPGPSYTMCLVVAFVEGFSIPLHWCCVA